MRYANYHFFQRTCDTIRHRDVERGGGGARQHARTGMVSERQERLQKPGEESRRAAEKRWRDRLCDGTGELWRDLGHCLYSPHSVQLETISSVARADVPAIERRAKKRATGGGRKRSARPLLCSRCSVERTNRLREEEATTMFETVFHALVCRPPFTQGDIRLRNVTRSCSLTTVSRNCKWCRWRCVVAPPFTPLPCIHCLRCTRRRRGTAAAPSDRRDRRSVGGKLTHHGQKTMKNWGDEF